MIWSWGALSQRDLGQIYDVWAFVVGLVWPWPLTLLLVVPQICWLGPVCRSLPGYTTVPSWCIIIRGGPVVSLLSYCVTHVNNQVHVTSCNTTLRGITLLFTVWYNIAQCNTVWCCVTWCYMVQRYDAWQVLYIWYRILEHIDNPLYIYVPGTHHEYVMVTVRYEWVYVPVYWLHTREEAMYHISKPRNHG